jgi:hypothetical protein
MNFILTPGAESERIDEELDTRRLLLAMRSKGPGPAMAAFDRTFRRDRGEASAPAHDALYPLFVDFSTKATLILLDALAERGDSAPELRDKFSYFQRIQALRRPREMMDALRQLLFAVSTELEYRGKFPRDAIRNGGVEVRPSWSRRLACLNGPGDLVGCLNEMAEQIDSLIEPPIETPKPGRPRKTELSSVEPQADDVGAAPALSFSPAAAADTDSTQHILRRKPRKAKDS